MRKGKAKVGVGGVVGCDTKTGFTFPVSSREGRAPGMKMKSKDTPQLYSWNINYDRNGFLRALNVFVARESCSIVCLAVVSGKRPSLDVLRGKLLRSLKK